MGHIAHLRKQFKSINTYDCIITLIKRRKKHYLLYENLLFLHLKKLESPSPKNDLCWDWLKLAHWFWRRFFNFVNVISRFRNYLPFEKGMALHLNKLISPSHKDALCQVWLKLAQWFWRRRWKCEKFTTTTTTTDNGQILIRKAHLSLRLRWAKDMWNLLVCITSKPVCINFQKPAKQEAMSHGIPCWWVLSSVLSQLISELSHLPHT